MHELTNYLNDVAALFGHPLQWTSSRVREALPGLERPQVFSLINLAGLPDILSSLAAAKIGKVAVLGINPTAFSAALALRQQNCKVTLLPSGCESDAIQSVLSRPDIAAFFAQHQITLHPHTAKQLRGSQVHCQSGYCGFICEGRFIEESKEVGCVLTTGGTIYIDAVIVATS